MKTKQTVIAAITSILLTSPLIFAEKGHKHDEHEAGRTAEAVQTKPYQLGTCIVSDEKLGEMGKPVVFVHQSQEIKLCCKDCRKDVDKAPAKYLKKLERKK